MVEDIGDRDRPGSLLRVDTVLDAVHIFVVVDVENLAQLQAVRIVRSVACAEGVLVEQSKGGETLRHGSCVEDFDSEHNWDTLERYQVESFPRKLNHRYSAAIALNFVGRVSGDARTPLDARRQTVFWVVHLYVDKLSSIQNLHGPDVAQEGISQKGWEGGSHHNRIPTSDDVVLYPRNRHRHVPRTYPLAPPFNLVFL